jgi:hypothetical protein
MQSHPIFWERPPHVAAASHRARGKSERQASATTRKRIAPLDRRNETLALILIRAQRLKLEQAAASHPSIARRGVFIEP